ncbi:MAG: GC-type dockerin domain-anchored protein [Phycisphaerales bacterium]|jgi:hypothetical protein|nr:GC-type dockerin domain-anchored protein [Phycisphaerales bacterium]
MQSATPLARTLTAVLGMAIAPSALAYQVGWLPGQSTTDVGGYGGWYDLTFAKTVQWQGRPQVVFSGAFEVFGDAVANDIVAFDGEAYDDLGGGFRTQRTENDGASISDVVVWPDANGVPGNDLLITTGPEYAWNGSTWSTFGSLSSGSVRSINLWDADGPGPIAPAPIITGQNLRPMGEAQNCLIAVWSGTNWTPLGGSSAESSLYSCVVPSNTPGVADEIYVGVGSDVRRFDGTAWTTVGTANASISTLFAWDPDGAGPLHALVIVEGGFSLIDDAPFASVAQYDGSQWSPMDGFPPSQYGIDRFCEWDQDEDPSTGNALVAQVRGPNVGGFATGGAFVWDGLAWNPVPGTSYVKSIATIGGDLVLGGINVEQANQPQTACVRWDGQGLCPLSNGFVRGRTPAMCDFDPDGAGGAPRTIVISSPEGFVSGGESLRGLLMKNGEGWELVPGSGFVGTGFGYGIVTTMTAWDPDGAGPENERLVAGGYMTIANGAPADYIAVWDGNTWQGLGAGTGTPVTKFETADLDGNGSVELIAACYGSNAVQVWDGTQWNVIATVPGTNKFFVEALHFGLVDANSSPQLIIGGTYTQINGQSRQGPCVYNGSTWSQIGTVGTRPNASALANYHYLGEDRLFAARGGLYYFDRSLQRWNSLNVPGAGGSLVVADLDGSGPMPAELIGLDFGIQNTPQGSVFKGIFRFDGSSFLTDGLGTGFRNSFNDSYDEQAPRGVNLVSLQEPGRDVPTVFLSGSFDLVDGQAIAAVARFGLSDAPTCAADWDGSGGEPNSSDFLAYLNDWASNAPVADLAPPGGDGSWDSSDFLAFLNHYALGCD